MLGYPGIVDRRRIELRTRGLQGDAVHQHSTRVPGATRTRTDQALDLAPLPLGYKDFTLGAQDSNLNELLQRQPCCRLHQLPWRPAG